MYANLLGEPEAVDEGFILGHVVGGSEVDLEGVLELITFRGVEDKAGTQTGPHLGAVEVHAPVCGVGWRWHELGLGPVDEEIGHRLGLDGGAWLVPDLVVGHGDGPFGYPAGGIPAGHD